MNGGSGEDPLGSGGAQVTCAGGSVSLCNPRLQP
jgi:hypothetical protein